MSDRKRCKKCGKVNEDIDPNTLTEKEKIDLKAGEFFCECKEEPKTPIKEKPKKPKLSQPTYDPPQQSSSEKPSPKPVVVEKEIPGLLIILCGIIILGLGILIGLRATKKKKQGKEEEEDEE